MCVLEPEREREGVEDGDRNALVVLVVVVFKLPLEGGGKYESWDAGIRSNVRVVLFPSGIGMARALVIISIPPAAAAAATLPSPPPLLNNDGADSEDSGAGAGANMSRGDAPFPPRLPNPSPR